MSGTGTAVTGTAPLHVLLPGDVDDATVPSGGNVYDRRVDQCLAAAGREVHEHALPGSWPRPDAAARAALGRTLAALPDGAVVLLDGLLACGVPDIVGPEARRLRLAVLVHLPLADETGLDPALAARLDALERETLQAAGLTVATSHWAARRLVDHHGLDPDRVKVVSPGTDPAPLAPGTDGAARLLVVASVTPRKGHDVLIEALAELPDLPWSCVCAGPLSRDPAHVARLRTLTAQHGLDDRVRFVGPRTGGQLEEAYAAADLMVLPSHAETYGLVVTEALARGIPVLATAVGGVPEALGEAPDGSLPGILIPAGDRPALTAALRRWFTDHELRHRLRASARQRRDALPGWEQAAEHMDAVLRTLEQTAGEESC